MAEPEWMASGACHGKPLVFWFEHELYPHGRKICGECAVQSLCLTYALDQRIWHGMWGGCSERERVRIRRKRRKAEAS